MTARPQIEVRKVKASSETPTARRTAQMHALQAAVAAIDLYLSLMDHDSTVAEHQRRVKGPAQEAREGLLDAIDNLQGLMANSEMPRMPARRKRKEFEAGRAGS